MSYQLDEVSRCCLCGRIVLGLKGQDTVLHGYALARDGSDQWMVDAGIVGPCHLRCLITSEYGRHWARRLTDFYTERYPSRVDGPTGTSVFRAPVGRHVHVLRSDGWHATLEVRELADATSVGGRCRVSTSSYIGVPYGEFEGLVTELLPGLQRTGEGELMALIQGLALMDCLDEPLAVRDGKVELATYVPGGRKVRKSGFSFLAYLARYEVLLPSDVFEEVSQLK